MSMIHCPICQSSLAFEHRTARCASGHSFDQAKSGYFNFINPKHTKSLISGDNKHQLNRRDAVLRAGWYDPLVDALAAALPKTPQNILDAGCGTGFYSAALAAQRPDTPHITAFDVSKDAVTMASKALTSAFTFVGDIWAPWPIQSNSMNVVLNVFSPKNFPEMARVLRRNGVLIIAFPNPSHLAALRQAFELMSLHDQKLEKYTETAAEWFEETELRNITWSRSLPPEVVRSIVEMGPNGKFEATGTETLTDEIETEFDINIMVCRGPKSGEGRKMP